MKIFISNDFFSAWVFTPPLILAAVLSSFANFFAIIYNTSKKTKGIFKTSMIAGVVNILMSITLIPFLGAFGAGVSSVVGFFIMWILRIRDSHDLIKLKINWNLLSKNFILIFFQMIFLYILEKENTLNLVQFIFVLLEIYINRDLFSILKKKGKI
nr:polysaccharide biosynthesis C-terminal domain-containing protein [Enterococcus gallinarum]